MPDCLVEATDPGCSMVVHTFGAYYGLAVARVLYLDDVAKAEKKEGSVYHSDIFAMIGIGSFIKQIQFQFNADY